MKILELTEQALLVSLSIRYWKGYKTDQVVTQEVEKNHTVKQAGKFNKKLLDSKDIAPVRAAAKAVYNFHRDNTLPWSDNGERLLPATNFFQYTEEMSRLTSNFDQVVTQFTRDYDQVLQAAKLRLNGMFREQDYPSSSKLKEKFSVRNLMLPAPAPTFNLALDSENLQELQKKSEAEIQGRLQEAQQELWNRVFEQLTRMSTILSSETSPIYESLFDSLSELVDVLPRLNLTNDQGICAVCEELKSLVVPTTEIRKDQDLRKSKAAEVEAILNKFSSYL